MVSSRTIGAALLVPIAVVGLCVAMVYVGRASVPDAKPPPDPWLVRGERDAKAHIFRVLRQRPSFFQSNAIITNYTAGVGTAPRFQISVLYMPHPVTGEWRKVGIQANPLYP